MHCCHQCCCCTAAAIDAGALLTRCRLALSPPCQVVHELLPLEILLLLLETPSDDGVEVAVDFIKEVRPGALLRILLFALLGLWMTVRFCIRGGPQLG